MYNNYVDEEYSEVIDSSLYTDQLIRSEYEETQTILTDNCSQYGITATCFDTFENLLWVGNQLVSKYTLVYNHRRAHRVCLGTICYYELRAQNLQIFKIKYNLALI